MMARDTTAAIRDARRRAKAKAHILVRLDAEHAKKLKSILCITGEHGTDFVRRMIREHAEESK